MLVHTLNYGYVTICSHNVDRQNVDRPNVEQTKCRTDKMSTNKMPNIHVDRQNACDSMHAKH